MVGVPHLSGREKLRTALLILATEPANIARRLEACYRTAITLIDPQLDLPPQLKDEFVRIRNELQKAYFAPAQAASLRTNRQEAWASELAGRLVAFYDKLIRQP